MNACVPVCIFMNVCVCVGYVYIFMNVCICVCVAKALSKGLALSMPWGQG